MRYKASYRKLRCRVGYYDLVRGLFQSSLDFTR